MMATIVRMPEIATGSAEAQVAQWLVRPGEAVSPGQVLAEIETEKAIIELEADAEGTLAGILVQAGQAVRVGTPIAVIAVDGESSEAALAQAASGQPREKELPQHSPGEEPPRVAAISERVFASPLVRRLAKERGLRLEDLRGSGPNGRIVRRDLPAPQQKPQAAGGDTVATPQPSGHAGATSRAENLQPAVTEIAHTGMRRAIARRLTESKNTIPHFYLSADCRVDALLALREQVNQVADQKVSINDFVVLAVVRALQEVAEANAIWTEESVHRFDTVDVSIAVAVESGLLTPVLRAAEQLSLLQVSAAIRELADRARAGQLKQHELQGGSFSISNLGMYGTQEFAAIINPPQSAILAVGAVTKRPSVSASGELEVASLMTVTLSADHRVLDGAVAARWLQSFKRWIDEPVGLLL